MSSTEGKPAGGERRRFYRVPARLPIRVCPLDPLEAEAIALEINTARTDPPEIKDPGVAAAIRRLEHKLNRILNYLDPEPTQQNPDPAPASRDTIDWTPFVGGIVTGTSLTGDEPMLLVGNALIPVSKVLEVRAPGGFGE